MYKVACNNPVYHLSLSDNSSGYEQTLLEKNLQLTELKFYINNIGGCLGMVDLLSTRRQDNQVNNFTSVLLSYKSIIYKSPNKPNQSIYLTMSPSKNTWSVPTVSNVTLAIVTPIPPTSPNLPYLTKYNLDDINTDIKSSNYKHHSKMKSMNEHIAGMLAKLTDTSSNTDNQEEKLIDISLKLSTYEDHIGKVIINEMLQPLSLQVNNEQDEKITDISYKISTY